MVCPLHGTSFVYDESLLAYDFGTDHPLKSDRIKKCLDILSVNNVIGGNQSKNLVVPPRNSTDEELLLFHTEAYLEFVKGASKTGKVFLDAGDTPAFPGCYEASLKVVGATLKAIELVVSGRSEHATNFSGGLHHARKGNASGFCIFNDCAVGLSILKKSFSRIAYIDIDAHHGDGVVYGFYDDPDVLAVDIHQDGNTLFPGTGHQYEVGSGEGEGNTINLPVPPGSGDDILLTLAREVVVPALRKQKPAFIILQCGADGLEGDPLAQLSYTAGGYISFVKQIHEASHELCNGRLVLVGGGGYNPDATANCWAAEYAAISCVDFSPAIKMPLSKSNRWAMEKIRQMEVSVRESFGLD
jgi:acetoin utilization protein AcuC